MTTQEYRKAQLEKIKVNEIYKASLKIVGGESGETKYIAITNEELEMIKNILIR